MPYPNEHSARIKAPEAFQPKSFRSKKITTGVRIIIGKLDGETSTTPQAYRFIKDEFTAAEAQAWLKKNKVECISFEPAMNDTAADVLIDETISTVARIDQLEYPLEDDGWMEHKFQGTPEGYLAGRAIVTNVGVFSYLMADGTIKRELRPPEEVFAFLSLETLRMVPVTNGHPAEGKVDSNNIKQHQVGFSGSDIRTDPFHLSIPISITDTDAVNDVADGTKRAMSCGYVVSLDETSGVWMGVPYDAVQRNIRYNHIALVNKGRAGDDAVIKMDSLGDSIGIMITDESQENTTEGGSTMAMKKITIDGVGYEAEAAVITAYTKAMKALEVLKVDTDAASEALKGDFAKVEAERDQLKADMEKIKADADKAKTDSPDELKEAVKMRLILFDAAHKADAEIKDEMTDLEIKKAVILKVTPTAKLDEKDDTYINARFDIICESLNENVDAAEADKTKLSGDVIGTSKSKKDEEDKFDSVAAYGRMRDRMLNASQPAPKEVM